MGEQLQERKRGGRHRLSTRRGETKGAFQPVVSEPHAFRQSVMIVKAKGAHPEVLLHCWPSLHSCILLTNLAALAGSQQFLAII